MDRRWHGSAMLAASQCFQSNFSAGRLMGRLTSRIYAPLVTRRVQKLLVPFFEQKNSRSQTVSTNVFFLQTKQ